jgi:hypothetical protein
VSLGRSLEVDYDVSKEVVGELEELGHQACGCHEIGLVGAHVDWMRVWLLDRWEENGLIFGCDVHIAWDNMLCLVS